MLRRENTTMRRNQTFRFLREALGLSNPALQMRRWKLRTRRKATPPEFLRSRRERLGWKLLGLLPEDLEEIYECRSESSRARQ